MQLRAVAVADNEGMQLRIDKLTARIQELERALQETQQNTTTTDYPMLEDTPSGPSSPGPSSVENGSDRESHDSYGKGCSPYRHLHFPTRFTGTLYLGAAGEAKFFGPTARSDYLAYVRGADLPRFHQSQIEILSGCQHRQIIHAYPSQHFKNHRRRSSVSRYDTDTKL